MRPKSFLYPDVEGDLEILKALARHPLLLPTDICALVNRSYKAVIARILKLKQHGLIRVHPTQADNRAMWVYYPRALQLTPKGAAKLNGYPCVPSTTKQFLHTLTESQVSASFEIGARQAGIEYVPLSLPPIAATFSFKGKLYENHKTVPDITLALGYGDDLYRFIAVECDLASEPIETVNRQRQAIETKMAAYLTVLSQALYESQWKLGNLTVLFTTTTEARLQTMKNLLSEMAQHAQIRNAFGFQIFPTLLGTQPKQGWAVSRPWLGVNKPLNLGD